MDADLLRHPAFVVGVAETPLGSVTDQTEFSMIALAAREALDEAGLSFADVDALFCNYLGEEGTVQLGEYLGVQPRWMDSTDAGGAAWELFVHHAVTAISAGRCNVALLAFASRQRSRRLRAMAPVVPDRYSLTAQFQDPYGLPMPIGHYALAAARHMHEFGTTREQLAEVAVAARRWAQLNPKAWERGPLTIDDVLASAPLATPLHKRDCCLVTDGGGVVIIANAAVTEGTRTPRIRVIGAGESQTHWHISQMPDLTVSAGAVSGREAFAQAGIIPTDVDVLQPYDSFTITVLLALEDLGFCGKGEGGAFVEDGRLGPGGALPSMTSGGGLSYNHPGALGILLLIEAVRQLRGEADDRQVPDARVAVAHGVGGLLSTAATVVLARD